MNEQNYAKLPTGVIAGNLHELVFTALPNNGDWHTLTAIVRVKDGEAQIDELMIRKIVADAG